LLIVPTYNEAENIEILVQQLRALPGDIHVLIVDDNSPDGTGQLVDAMARQDSGVQVLHRPGKLGLGSAYKAGFKTGLRQGYTFLCTMDADFSHDPALLPQLLAKASLGYDLVIGSRYVPGGKIVGSTSTRQFISYSANWLAHLLLGVTARDCTAGFRCYRYQVLETINLDAIFSSGYSFLIEMAFHCQQAGFRCYRYQVLETINLDAIFSSGYSFLIEMAFHCQQAGFRIGEVPITFVNRRKGISKISKNEIYKAFYTLVRLRTSALPWQQMDDLYQRRWGRRV